MACEKKSWYSVVLTAIHLCRPLKDQLSMQQAALHRPASRLEDIDNIILRAKQHLSVLHDKRDLAVEWVQRHHEAMNELRASPQAMEAYMAGTARPPGEQAAPATPMAPLPVGPQPPQQMMESP
eukprot:5659694-Pyramimonas_sp.AAC.1